MLKILKKFFDFCSVENRKKFYVSIVFGVISALFSAMKIPTIGVLFMAILNGKITNTSIFPSFGIMRISILGTSLIKSKSNMLQTEAGYGTCADKRMEIAENMSYLTMGYFNTNSLGYITSVTTNIMENLSDSGTITLGGMSIKNYSMDFLMKNFSFVFQNVYLR